MDVCSLAAVSPIFRAAANSDCVWEAMLPPRYLNILSAAVSPLVFSSKKDLYFLLCDSILIDNGTKRLWLERSTGKICYMLSASDLRIVWGDDERYWRWVSRDDSRFEVVAEVMSVCWLEAKGGIECSMLSPKTEYSVSFVVKLGRRHYGWNVVPIKFSVKRGEGIQVESSRYLVEREGASRDEGLKMTPVRDGSNGWKELVGGDFTVEKNGDGPTHVEFCMKEVHSGRWKSGLLLDGVKIQPKRT